MPEEELEAVGPPGASGVGGLIEKAIIYLLYNTDMPFYAHLIQQFQRIRDTKMEYAAGVSITEKLNLYINPVLFGKYKLRPQAAVLVHELLHIIDNHPGRRGDRNAIVYNKNGNPISVWNIACDIAVNQYIKDLPEGSLYPSTYPALNMPPEALAEVYYDILTSNAIELELEMPGDCQGGDGDADGEDGEGQNESAKGNGEGRKTIRIKYKPIDDHSKWSDSTCNADMATELIKQAVKSALRQTESGIGTLPAGIQRMIDRAQKHKTIAWKRQLNIFIARATIPQVEFSRKRRNRRFGYLYPGKKIFRRLNLGLIVDCSGSTTEWLSQFNAEMLKIRDQDVEVYVIEFDGAITNEYKFTKCVEPTLKGGGGTQIKPALDRAIERKFDAIVILTDYAIFDLDKITKPSCPVLWVITPNGDKTAKLEFGAKIFIPEPEK